MNILITWWLWYIGSHTVVELLQQNYSCLILDNLSNSSVDVLEKIEAIAGQRPDFIQGDITDRELLHTIFDQKQIDAVIHFAWLKAVWESCQDPFKYYHQNIGGTITLLEAMQEHNVKKMIFSSSATVYDAANDEAPFHEESRTGSTTNPYGTTKFAIEQLLRDLGTWKGYEIIALRYFNPIGAHSSWLIGEDPQGIPSNLFPYLMRVATGQYESLSVYGDDYDTADGSCIRDYIHVVDLAQAHVAALEHLTISDQAGCDMINIGTGTGTSVLEMIAAVQEAVGHDIAHTIVGRRDGDIPVSVAGATKAEQVLWRKAQLTVEDAVRDGWRFYASDQ
jgi:UDP-glucose 4-epimerase